MTTHQSKWGFHPCDFEGYKKLKRLHAAYFKGLRLIAKHKRWERKMPHNRKAEPVVPAVYRSLVNSDIVYRYHLARIGVAGPEGVSPISGSYWEVVESWIAGLDEVHVAC